ncbi:MAG TPA: zinc ribbon domain-containing protein [Gaiellaceae bacterium]|nr:zinc ribbon domain-containing protein [Gaiellaceae bacterium]
MTTVGGDDPERTAQHCPRCSEPVEPRQEYCLTCGLRLPADRGVVDDASTPAESRTRSSGWLGPALVGLVIAVAGTVAAIAISDSGAEPDAVTVAIGGSRTAPEPATTLTAPEPPAATTAAPRTRARPAAPRAPVTTAWPAGRRGWTIVLMSVPQSGGRALANQRAAEARQKGLTDVGVLNSSRFASLHPGYFVVFTGVFEAQPEATSALPRARAAFPLAYAREIVP